jgi:CBS domain-containing protein
MRIERVLQDKGGGVTTIDRGSTVADVAKLLSEQRIGAVIVCENSTPVGILSERDIVRELGRRGPDCLHRKAGEMMTTSLKYCALDDHLDEILSKMTDGRFRHMPVMKDGKMVGLVSIGDIVKARLSELSMERDALEGMVRGH